MTARPKLLLEALAALSTHAWGISAMTLCPPASPPIAPIVWRALPPPTRLLGPIPKFETPRKFCTSPPPPSTPLSWAHFTRAANLSCTAVVVEDAGEEREEDELSAALAAGMPSPRSWPGSLSFLARFSGRGSDSATSGMVRDHTTHGLKDERLFASEPGVRKRGKHWVLSTFDRTRAVRSIARMKAGRTDGGVPGGGLGLVAGGDDVSP